MHELVHTNGDCHNDRADILRWVPCDTSQAWRAHSAALYPQTVRPPCPCHCRLPARAAATAPPDYLAAPGHTRAVGVTRHSPQLTRPLPLGLQLGRLQYKPAGKDRAHKWGTTHDSCPCLGSVHQWPQPHARPPRGRHLRAQAMRARRPASAFGCGTPELPRR
jgi:hypothetical protein